MRDGSNLRIRAVNTGTRLKINLYNRSPVYGRGLDVLDIVDGRCERPLKDGCESPFHLLRVEATISPGHGNHRNIDAGKDVGRRAQNHDRAQNEYEQRHDDEGIGPG